MMHGQKKSSYGVRGLVWLLVKRVWNYSATKCLLVEILSKWRYWNLLGNSKKNRPHTQHLIIVIQKATSFDFTKQPSSGLTFQKYKIEILERKAW